MADTFPRIEPLGEAALLVRFAASLSDSANRASVAFRAALEDAHLPGIAETASTLGSVLVRMESDADAGALTTALSRMLDQQDWANVPPPPRRSWAIPCSFAGQDAPQLAEAADLAGLTEAQAIEALTSQTVRVLALGFAPGMPYLGILPPEWDLPRQTGLTPKVPEGALVVAVRQFVLFGTEAPTGWRQIGRTLFGCFEPSRPRPIALTPGDDIRFVPVSPDDLRAKAAADPHRHGGAACETVA